MAKEFIVLVGNIGTGKTKYCNEHFSEGYEIVRTDDWPEMEAEIKNEKFNAVLFELAEKGKNIVIDGVHIRAEFRKNLVLLYASGRNYKSIVIGFGPGNDYSLQKRIIESRGYSEEQIIKVHFKNQSIYQPPSKDEGFDEIIKQY